MKSPDFWKGKKVLITGHTGFKGSWLASCLKILGANVTGYSLAPPTNPNLYDLAKVADGMSSLRGDVRDFNLLHETIKKNKSEIIFHLAAQSLVRKSYEDPLETYSTNVMGTANLLEAVRKTGETRVVVVVTSDKCYENRETDTPYSEEQPMGGWDPYSSSKGCAELVTTALRKSFFNTNNKTLIASARAGNVIGGGDWAQDRLVPDLITAFSKKTVATVRSPSSTRPWQHVLEPISGYLLLAEKLWGPEGSQCAEGWNFGPENNDSKPVSWIADQLEKNWGDGAKWEAVSSKTPLHEAEQLCLDSTKARRRLGWNPKLSLEKSLQWTVDWYRNQLQKNGAREITESQINKYRDL